MEYNHDIDQVRQLLSASGAAGMLVESQANFHWLAGGRGFIGLNSETACAALLITPDRQYLVANNIESRRLLAEEVGGGFELLEFPWYDDSARAGAIRQACPGTMIRDSDFAGEMQRLRTALSARNIAKMRRSGPIVGRILEQELLATKRGTTELELAGRLSSRLWREKIEPVTILIGFDRRTELYRHLLPTAARLDRSAIASLAVRCDGLFISVTRHVYYGNIPAAISDKYRAVCNIHAGALHATRVGATMDQVFRAIVAAYGHNGYADQWQLHHQGGLTGFVSRERRAMPGDNFVIAPNQAFAWNPTIAGVKSEETVLLHGDGAVEILTAGGDWPATEHDGILLPDIAVQ